MNPAEFMKSYESALATQDWDAVAPLIHEDACVTFSSGDYFKGKTEIRQAFERNFSLIQDERYSISEVHWVSRSEDFAVCVYAFRWEGLIQGEPASGAGRGTSILIAEGGRWSLLAEHLGPRKND
jgi:ketosteroid isomerase-like protein